MGRAIDLDKAIEIIEEKQKELCPVGRYGRKYVYGSDREKYDAWEEIIDTLDALPTLPQPSNEALAGWVSVEERLPDKKQDVLMYFDSGNMAVGWWYDEDEHITFWCAYTDDGFYTDCDCIPTNWMPLPAPPNSRPPEGEEDA